MRSRKWIAVAVLALTAGTAMVSARAQIPVTDIGAIAQLISELETLEQQLQVARQELAQAQSEYQAITGGRGMERLLAGTTRNYLPPTWPEVQSAATGANGAYPGLTSAMQSTLSANAVLSDAQLASFSPADRQQLQADRQSAALQQVLAQQALVVTSNRFASLQQLIDAIPTATDEKAVLDLHARIGAEQTMLQNEQSKLALLREAAQADLLANQVRAREQALAAQGNFATRFQPTP
jgi:type IV secretion system protein VirB5